MSASRFALVIVTFAYLVLACVGALAIARRAALVPTYATLRAFARDHRIAPGDVAAAPVAFMGPDADAEAFENRFAVRDFAAGAAIELSDVTRTPSLAAGRTARGAPASVLVWVPLPAGSAGDRLTIDAGTPVDLCDAAAAAPCLGPYAVDAVVCDAAKPPACSAGVWVPEARAASAARARRLFVRST